MNTADRWAWLLRPGPDEAGALTLQGLDAALHLVVRAVAGAVACSITELAGGTYRTSVASARVALDLDVVQYRSGDGPCMTAARDRQQQLMRDMTTANRFTEFAAAAARLEVRSSLSIPVRTTYHPAALNLYSRDADGFDERSCAVADLLGRALTARMIGSSGTRPLSISESVQVSRRRTLIFAAQQASASAGQDPTDAFTALARQSAHEGRSIFTLAGELVGDNADQPADRQADRP